MLSKERASYLARFLFNDIVAALHRENDAQHPFNQTIMSIFGSIFEKLGISSAAAEEVIE